MNQNAIDYSRICFVIMPFGTKAVQPPPERKNSSTDRPVEKAVNFDTLYTDIFVPAISAVDLPEGGKLEPHRTDRDFFAGDIKQDMFDYLEYSRFALCDISGLNPNVMYELGVRHRAREAGTAIFRQTGLPLPFDINSIKAFPYDYEPAEAAAQARALITKVLDESLQRNRIDSPVRIALRQQRQSGKIDDLLKQAEDAIRKVNFPGAMDIYRQAVAIAPDNPLPRMKLGLLCRDRGIWQEALEQFTRASEIAPDYPEAWRERGIAENKIAADAKRPMDGDPAPGEESLRRAVAINDKDFDAYASLGGVLKRAGRIEQSRDAYDKSQQLSGGHPYPLLNALKLRAALDGKLGLTGPDKIALARAQRFREGQAQQNPPFDSPWCFFDLAEIKLYRGDAHGFLDTATQGFEHTDHDWQGKSFVKSLRLLLPAASELPGLTEGLAELEKLLPPEMA
ncbi:tetratricopeptide repeat protein [Bradyrhizobium sp. CSA207]|uniref:tetratricopeptide repeat protein n=1 Tax=Bradyrhizobium sp. CSA207 TaxID=2698826 RepID=UPI0023AE8D75|nr:tetratricopeptide repeat protein [Bradyrhizobium sp. CSA207]MDE5446377.1 tetratricopeptide repeat protein [Bradyrhizobium sp. CSA207]